MAAAASPLGLPRSRRAGVAAQGPSGGGFRTGIFRTAHLRVPARRLPTGSACAVACLPQAGWAISERAVPCGTQRAKRVGLPGNRRHVCACAQDMRVPGAHVSQRLRLRGRSRRCLCVRFRGVGDVVCSLACCRNPLALEAVHWFGFLTPAEPTCRVGLPPMPPSWHGAAAHGAAPGQTRLTQQPGPEGASGRAAVPLPHRAPAAGLGTRGNALPPVGPVPAVNRPSQFKART